MINTSATTTTHRTKRRKSNDITSTTSEQPDVLEEDPSAVLTSIATTTQRSNLLPADDDACLRNEVNDDDGDDHFSNTCIPSSCYQWLESDVSCKTSLESIRKCLWKATQLYTAHQHHRLRLDQHQQHQRRQQQQQQQQQRMIHETNEENVDDVDDHPNQIMVSCEIGRCVQQQSDNYSWLVRHRPLVADHHPHRLHHRGRNSPVGVTPIGKMVPPNAVSASTTTTSICTPKPAPRRAYYGKRPTFSSAANTTTSSSSTSSSLASPVANNFLSARIKMTSSPTNKTFLFARLHLRKMQSTVATSNTTTTNTTTTNTNTATATNHHHSQNTPPPRSMLHFVWATAELETIFLKARQQMQHLQLVRQQNMVRQDRSFPWEEEDQEQHALHISTRDDKEVDLEPLLRAVGKLHYPTTTTTNATTTTSVNDCESNSHHHHLDSGELDSDKVLAILEQTVACIQDLSVLVHVFRRPSWNSWTVSRDYGKDDTPPTSPLLMYSSVVQALVWACLVPPSSAARSSCAMQLQQQQQQQVESTRSPATTTCGSDFSSTPSPAFATVAAVTTTPRRRLIMTNQFEDVAPDDNEDDEDDDGPQSTTSYLGGEKIGKGGDANGDGVFSKTAAMPPPTPKGTRRRSKNNKVNDTSDMLANQLAVRKMLQEPLRQNLSHQASSSHMQTEDSPYTRTRKRKLDDSDDATLLRQVEDARRGKSYNSDRFLSSSSSSTSDDDDDDDTASESNDILNNNIVLTKQNILEALDPESLIQIILARPPQPTMTMTTTTKLITQESIDQHGAAERNVSNEQQDQEQQERLTEDELTQPRRITVNGSKLSDISTPKNETHVSVQDDMQVEHPGSDTVPETSPFSDVTDRATSKVSLLRATPSFSLDDRENEQGHAEGTLLNDDASSVFRSAFPSDIDKGLFIQNGSESSKQSSRLQRNAKARVEQNIDGGVTVDVKSNVSTQSAAHQAADSASCERELGTSNKILSSLKRVCIYQSNDSDDKSSEDCESAPNMLPLVLIPKKGKPDVAVASLLQSDFKSVNLRGKSLGSCNEANGNGTNAVADEGGMRQTVTVDAKTREALDVDNKSNGRDGVADASGESPPSNKSALLSCADFCPTSVSPGLLSGTVNNISVECDDFPLLADNDSVASVVSTPVDAAGNAVYLSIGSCDGDEAADDNVEDLSVAQRLSQVPNNIVERNSGINVGINQAPQTGHSNDVVATTVSRRKKSGVDCILVTTLDNTMQAPANCTSDAFSRRSLRPRKPKAEPLPEEWQKFQKLPSKVLDFAVLATKLPVPSESSPSNVTSLPGVLNLAQSGSNSSQNQAAGPDRETQIVQQDTDYHAQKQGTTPDTSSRKNGKLNNRIAKGETIPTSSRLQSVSADDLNSACKSREVGSLQSRRGRKKSKSVLENDFVDSLVSTAIKEAARNDESRQSKVSGNSSEILHNHMHAPISSRLRDRKPIEVANADDSDSIPIFHSLGAKSDKTGPYSQSFLGQVRSSPAAVGKCSSDNVEPKSAPGRGRGRAKRTVDDGEVEHQYCDLDYTVILSDYLYRFQAALPVAFGSTLSDALRAIEETIAAHEKEGDSTADHEYNEEIRLQKQSFRILNQRADQERLESMRFAEASRLRQREIEYYNRKETAGEEKAELERLCSQPIRFVSNKEWEEAKKSKCCFGYGCSLCSKLPPALSDRKPHAVVPAPLVVPSKVNDFWDTTRDEPDDSDLTSSRSRRSRRNGGKIKQALLMLHEMRHSLRFIDDHNTRARMWHERRCNSSGK